MPDDLYQPPIADPTVKPNLHPAETGDAPAVVVEHLRCTRPWVKFCSIAGYVTSTFLILIGILILRGMIGNFPIQYIILLGCFYFILSILFIIPSLWLSRYEKSITHLEVSGRIEDLEQAIAYQRSFWRNTAIMILIIMLIYLTTIALSAIALLSGKLAG